MDDLNEGYCGDHDFVWPDGHNPCPMCQSAKEIQRLRAQNAKLIAALGGCEQTLLDHIDCARNETTSSKVWESVKRAIDEAKEGENK